MKVWKYGELSIDTSVQAAPKLIWHDGTRNQIRGANEIDELNKLGKDGWEVVGMAATGSVVRYILKHEAE